MPKKRNNKPTKKNTKKKPTSDIDWCSLLGYDGGGCFQEEARRSVVDQLLDGDLPGYRD